MKRVSADEAIVAMVRDRRQIAIYSGGIRLSVYPEKLTLLQIANLNKYGARFYVCGKDERSPQIEPEE